MHRSDGSGTTYIFSNYLSSVDPAWAAKVGTGKTLNWPIGEGAEGNGSVTSTVFRTPFSIGYVEQAYSQGLLLPFAAIRNQAGNYVLPSTQTVTAAAAQKPAITPTDFSIVNQPGASSYPISGYSWALIYTHQPSQATGQALVTMLDWLTHDGQAYAAANLYVPLPPQVRQLARHHAPAGHRPQRDTPAELTRDTIERSRSAWRFPPKRPPGRSPGMPLSSYLTKPLRWLRAGYPAQAPPHAYVPLIALMPSPAAQVEDRPSDPWSAPPTTRNSGVWPR